MKITDLPCVKVTGAITWRAGGGRVIATVQDKSVMFIGDWPLDVKTERAALLRLAQEFPGLEA